MIIVKDSIALDDLVERDDGHFELIDIPSIEGTYFRGSKDYLIFVENYLKEKKVDFAYQDFGDVFAT